MCLVTGIKGEHAFVDNQVGKVVRIVEAVAVGGGCTAPLFVPEIVAELDLHAF